MIERSVPRSWVSSLYRCPDLWNIALNAGAQLQVPAQYPQLCGDLRNPRLDSYVPPPFSLV